MQIAKIATIALLAVFATTGSYASISEATPDSTNTKARTSAGQGLKNMLLGWTEIPKSIGQVTRDSKNPIWGLTGGTCKGIGKALPRTISGAASVVESPTTKPCTTTAHPDTATQQAP